MTDLTAPDVLRMAPEGRLVQLPQADGTVLEWTLEKYQAVVREARHELWRRGRLDYLFHDTQKKIHDTVATARTKSDQRLFYLLCSRRLGKSYYLVAMAFMFALSRPNARVLYLAPTAKAAMEITVDTAGEILVDCPDDVKPTLKEQAKEFVFGNGSMMRVKGVNGETASNLRGGTYDLVILDECGQMDRLKSVVNDVVLPMTLTTKGLILFATTPPTTPGHDSVEIYERLAGEAAAVKFTLLDAPHIEDIEKARMLKAVGEDPARIPDILAGRAMPETTTALREFFLEFVTDADSAVLPEFRRMQSKVVVEWPTPAFRDRYVSMDPGMKDRTGVVFAYVDSLKGRLVVEDELLLHNASTNKISAAVKEREGALWGDFKPYMRISDVDLRLIADLREQHGLQFTQARKEDSLGAVNLMRNMLQNEQLIINPRCKHLIRQCQNAIWNSRATDFARPESTQAIDGHYDLVAALKYLCRMVNWKHNPYPANYYAMGMPLGPPNGSWISPKRKRKDDTGLYGNTPFGRRLAKAKRGGR